MTREYQDPNKDPMCILCDYWWAILILLILILAAFLTRRLWLPAEYNLGTGDIQTTIRWSGLNDLDLVVIDPSGEKIFFDHPASMSGGQLDLDSNAMCTNNVTNNPIENIYWPSGKAPKGNYKVSVLYYARCSPTDSQTPFTIDLLVDGKTETFSGVLKNEKDIVNIKDFTR